jgi:hypothetical protein
MQQGVYPLLEVLRDEGPFCLNSVLDLLDPLVGVPSHFESMDSVVLARKYFLQAVFILTPYAVYYKVGQVFRSQILSNINHCSLGN